MPKDPAFLFYPSDFLVGTFNFTDAQRGQYIVLLCLQHQSGHLEKDVMLDVMHGEEDMKIMSKFMIDENGLFYNARLEKEINRRVEYAKSRSRNRSSKKTSSHDEDMKNISNRHDRHMETITITETNNNVLTESEMTALADNIHRVLDAAKAAGFPDTSATWDKLNLIVADHGADAVLTAIDICVEANVCNLRYLKGILNKDKQDDKHGVAPGYVG